MTQPGLLREIRKNWQNYALMAPFLLLFATFTLIPIVYSVAISFTSFNIFTVLSGVVIPVLYIVGAFQLKNQAD